MRVEPDGALRSFYSLPEGRALFGFEQLTFCKVQAGIVVHAQRPDWVVRPNPRSVQFSGKIFEGIDVFQSLDFHRGRSQGYIRRLRTRNGSQAPIKLRVLELLDPTAAHFSGPSETWGSLGVNAFNRESHVAMDEVSDPPSARVVGATPPPSKFFMTTNGPRALELVSAGELPDSTAGMSGQVLVVSSHDVELAPGESKEITFASIYNAGKLEDALSEFGRLESGERQPEQSRPFLACSEREVTESAAWAFPALEGGAYSKDALDRYEVIRALSLADPAGAVKVIAGAKAAVRSDGSLPHALQPSAPGLLETSLLLRAVADHCLLAQDRKLARAHYPLVKKLAGYLFSSSKDFAVVTDPSLPQGWRRHLGSGYPTGEVPEVSLAAAGALTAASCLARMLSKSDDASRFRERSEMISDRLRKKLVDERGFIALCRDSSGRLRGDDTVDMAVAAYRHPFMGSAEQGAAHRLLEKDFETPYGPRCVPTTNQVYFNGAYGMGQLGGVWTRAALAHAVVCYRAGLSGIGSLALERVARLVADEATRLGGTPGDFPLWVDAENRAAHGDESDPVAAARFLEVLIEGELGLSVGVDGASVAPAPSSSLGWVLACDIWAGEAFSAFLGRGGGKAHLFAAGGKLTKEGTKFAKSERLDLPVKGVYGVTFYSPGQIICLGNSAASSARFSVTFTPRAGDLTKHLSTPLEEYDPGRCSWSRTGSLRVSPAMTFEAMLEPNGWKVYRLSTA
ncbi:MAG: hypothetical protein JRN45_00880 [Nitrososphaerota archaeon]|nr:hypothetical protein [Nitrososphaerota archaeon]